MPAFSSYLMDIIGTVAFSVAGAMVAVDRRMDLFGVLSMGIVTAMGGGVVRDLLMGRFPPVNFYNYTGIALALGAAFLVFVAVSMFKERYQRHRDLVSAVNNVFDAIGLASFSVAGVQIALSAGYGEKWVFCIFLGMITGVGGGILRDTLCGTVPFVFTKHIYAVASILGSWLYYCLLACHLYEMAAAVIAMVAVIVVRLLATTYRWNLPRIAFETEAK